MRYPPVSVRAAGWYMFAVGVLLMVALFFGAVLGTVTGGTEGLVAELSARAVILAVTVAIPSILAAVGLRVAYPVALAAAGYGLVSGLLAWGENPQTLGVLITIPPFLLLLWPASWRWALGLDRRASMLPDEVPFKLPRRGEDWQA